MRTGDCVGLGGLGGLRATWFTISSEDLHHFPLPAADIHSDTGFQLNSISPMGRKGDGTAWWRV